jgi:hypothetical protein
MSSPNPARQPASETLPAGNSWTAGNQSRPHQVQAAQLEHNSSTTRVHSPIDALAGGASAPQSPQPAQAKAPARKNRRKRRDNHVSVRFDDAEDDIITRRMEATGETQSQAVRALIRASESSERPLILHPKAPPQELEVALGMLAGWRKAFAAARPRINMPTPINDPERYEEVKAWRLELNRLLKEIPELEKVVKVALAALTSLTAERITGMKTLKKSMRQWAEQRRQKGELEMAQKYEAVVDLLEDLGGAE